MKHLYAPWRGTYTQEAHVKEKKSGCPFCAIIQSSDDAKNYILHRYKNSIVILNLYPYNPGHLLIIPLQHAAALHDLSSETRAELMEITTKSIQILEKIMGTTGTNIGANLGDEASGGSIPDHLHIHVVPRWKGDTNFMPIIAQTKPLSADLHIVFETLKKEFCEE